MIDKLKGALKWVKQSGFMPALYKVATKKTTIGVIVGTIVGLAGWDVVVATNKEKGDTISEILLKASKGTPMVGVAWGILTGHLFWPQAKTPSSLPSTDSEEDQDVPGEG